MARTVDAIFEEGVFKPLSPLNISEHKRIKLIIEDESEEPSDILSLASMVYNGFSPEDIVDIEKVVLDRTHFSRD
jgi:predicted DNA-binding antitoxin AbrB/MazE fold protein